jgi:signal transduction histidine kinase/limonene-1,2-epoxide hydrolase
MAAAGHSATGMHSDSETVLGRRSLSSVPRPGSIVARSYEVFNTRDFDAYPEVLDEHVELVLAGVAVHGLAAVIDFLKVAASSRTGLRIETQRVFLETEDTFVTEVRMVDTTDDQDAAGVIEYSGCGLYRLAGGRIAEWRVYLDSPAEVQAAAAFAATAAEQSALRRVAEFVARHAPAEDVFVLVTTELSQLLKLEMVRTLRFEPDGTATVLAALGRPEDRIPPGTNMSLPHGGVLEQVCLTGRPALVEDYAQIAGPTAKILWDEGVRRAAGGPIVVDGRVWGAMVVGSPTADALPVGSEDRVARFAELVSTAISNIESRTKVERLAAEQSALRRVATLVAREHSPDELLATLVEELGVLLEVDATAILRYEADSAATVVAGWSDGGIVLPLGDRLPLEGENLAGEVRLTGLPSRKEDYAAAPGRIAATVRELGIQSAVATPIIVEGTPWGAIAVLSRRPEPLPGDTEARLAEFSSHAGMAVANAKSRDDLAQSRARIVRAGDEARRRFERDLHDGAQQRLVSLGLELRAAEETVPGELGDLRRVLSDLGAGLTDVLDDLRELSRGLHPAVLSEGGLTPALHSLARRSPVPVDMRVDLDAERFEEPVEVAVYYATSEALTNTAKHANASRARMTVTQSDGRIELLVSDDGRGGADASSGSGLTGLVDRVEAMGGTIQIDSPPNAGTEIRVRLPTRPR